jgi:hypothetical protein
LDETLEFNIEYNDNTKKIGKNFNGCEHMDIKDKD